MYTTSSTEGTQSGADGDQDVSVTVAYSLTTDGSEGGSENDGGASSALPTAGGADAAAAKLWDAQVETSFAPGGADAVAATWTSATDTSWAKLTSSGTESDGAGVGGATGAGATSQASAEATAADAQSTVSGGDASGTAAVGTGSSAATDLSKPAPEGGQGDGGEVASNAAESPGFTPSYREYQRGTQFRRWQGAGRRRGGKVSYKSERINDIPAYENPFLKRNGEQGEGEDDKSAGGPEA